MTRGTYGSVQAGLKYDIKMLGQAQPNPTRNMNLKFCPNPPLFEKD